MCQHTPSPTPRLGRRALLRGAGVAAAGLAGAGTLGSAVAAVQETSQNGWPAASDLPRNRSFAVDGVLFPSGVANGAPDVVLGYVARQFAATVEPLVDPGCWGFSYRAVTGGTSLSNHASGTAIDINAPAHPYGAAGTFSASQVSAIRAILAHCDGVVRWGGDYSGTKDEMHFELNRPPGAAVDALVHKLGGSPQPPARPTLSEGDTGQAVRDAQSLLNTEGGYGLAVDGVFGPGTKAAVVDFQRRHGLAADGVIGPRTWAVLDA